MEKITRTVPLPPVLIKVGKKDHIESLYENGDVFFRTFKDFREMENVQTSQDNPIALRNDEFEGLERSLSGRITFSPSHDKSLKFQVDDAKINIYQNKYSHLYCLYGFSHDIKRGFKIDQRMSLFGDTAVIFNSKIFLTELANTLSDYKVDFDMDYVKYYSNEYSGVLGPFYKREIYSYQYEYRIATNVEINNIFIGNVLKKQSDSIIISSNQLHNIKLHFG